MDLKVTVSVYRTRRKLNIPWQAGPSRLSGAEPGFWDKVPIGERYVISWLFQVFAYDGSTNQFSAIIFPPLKGNDKIKERSRRRSPFMGFFTRIHLD
jgi:hypothetical protein